MAKASIIVAVIDTGVAYKDEGEVAEAPELKGVPFVSPYDFVWDDQDPIDLDGHGTHISGTIAQATNNNAGPAGIAFNVSIMPIKALYTDWDAELGAPFPYGASTVGRAIRYAADNGAKVINLSLGSFLPNTATRDAMVYAIGKGTFIAIAAGNDAETGNPLTYPAVYANEMDGAVAVAAVDFNLKHAYYSNVNDYVEIAAPGGDTNEDLNDDGYGDGILQQTLDPDAVSAGVFNRFIYYFAEGTSMATAHVSGLAALLMDQGIQDAASGREGDEGVCDGRGAERARQRDRLRRHQSACDHSRPRAAEIGSRPEWRCVRDSCRAQHLAGVLLIALSAAARRRRPGACAGGESPRARCASSRTAPRSGAGTRAWCWRS